MKSILLHASNDESFNSRFNVAMDVAKRMDAHLTMLNIQPYRYFSAVEVTGTAQLLQTVLAEVEKLKAELKEKVSADLRGESVKWGWVSADGDNDIEIIRHSRLSDLIVMSIGTDAAIKRNLARDMVGAVALDGGRPVLAVPHQTNAMRFDRAMIAYDGGRAAANAIRASLPLLSMAQHVELVEVEEKETAFPNVDAAEYLARHNISCDVREISNSKDNIAETLLAHAKDCGGDYLVMGAYGHSRLRERLFGGVTKTLLAESHLPLVLAG